MGAVTGWNPNLLTVGAPVNVAALNQDYVKLAQSPQLVELAARRRRRRRR